MSHFIHQSTLIGLLCCFPIMTATAQTCQNITIPATTVGLGIANNGTIIDRKTGLMWKQCSEGLSGKDCTNYWNANGTGIAKGVFTWQEALQQAQTVNTTGGFAGFTDWRLPNIQELRSIVERQCYYPSINLMMFPNTSPERYWSSSSAGEWGVNFSFGKYDWTAKSSLVRLVRGGQ